METTQDFAGAGGQHSLPSESEMETLIREEVKAYTTSPNWNEDITNFFFAKITGLVHGKCCFIAGCQGNCGFAEKYPNFMEMIDACFNDKLREDTTFLLQTTGTGQEIISTEPTGESVCSSNDNSLEAYSAVELPGTPQHLPLQLTDVVILTVDVIPPAETGYFELLPGTNPGTSLGNTSSQLKESTSLTMTIPNTMGTSDKPLTVASTSVTVPNPEILGTKNYKFPVELLDQKFWEEITGTFLCLTQKSTPENSIATILGKNIYDFIFTEEEKVICFQRPMQMTDRHSDEMIKTRAFDAIKKELVYCAISFAMKHPEKNSGDFFAALGAKDESVQLSIDFKKHVNLTVFTNHASKVRAEKRKNPSGESAEKNSLKKTK